MEMTILGLTYILPLRRERIEPLDELVDYLRWLSTRAQVVVVDGSPPDIFAVHAKRWESLVTHVPPDAERATPMGKVGGVLTGVARADHEKLIIADDDVRYDESGLARMDALLDTADVVRPQNFFGPLPWHAYVDTARALLNRMTGGDWPGTLGVQRSVLRATGGYDGDVMFENLELVRTVRAAGGIETVPLDLFVLRAPPDTRQFRSQRVRQAYDELARPARLGVSLALLPTAALLAARKRWGALALGAGAAVALAEAGRRRAGGEKVFPAIASFFAPVWIAERAVCIWLAVGARVVLGGVSYRGSRLKRAATPMRELRRRHAAAAALTRESRDRSV